MLMCRRTHWRGQRIVHSSTALPRYKTNEQIEREKRHHDEYEEKSQPYQARGSPSAPSVESMNWRLDGTACAEGLTVALVISFVENWTPLSARKTLNSVGSMEPELSVS